MRFALCRNVKPDVGVDPRSKLAGQRMTALAVWCGRRLDWIGPLAASIIDLRRQGSGFVMWSRDANERNGESLSGSEWSWTWTAQTALFGATLEAVGLPKM